MHKNISYLNWGNQQHRDNYERLLKYKVALNWLTIVLFGAGVVAFIVYAFAGLAAIWVGMVIWTIGLLGMVLLSKRIESNLNRYERFYDIYEKRHLVRHQFCYHWWQCLVLHRPLENQA